jgi:hypothetical protein
MRKKEARGRRNDHGPNAMRSITLRVQCPHLWYLVPRFQSVEFEHGTISGIQLSSHGDVVKTEELVINERPGARGKRLRQIFLGGIEREGGECGLTGRGPGKWRRRGSL